MKADIKPIEYWQSYSSEDQPEINSFENLFDLMFQTIEEWEQESDEGRLPEELKNELPYHLSVYHYQGGPVNVGIIQAMIAQL